MFTTVGSRALRRRIASPITPAGANTNVQFNNAGALGGDAGFTYSGIAGGGVNIGSSVITGSLVIGSSTFPNQPSITLSSTAGAAWQNYINNGSGGGGKWTLYDQANNRLSISRTGLALLVVNGGTSYSWASGGAEQNPDTGLYRDAAAGLVSLANITTPANACTFRVYNTVDNTNNTAPVNYERGVFDWTTTANTLTIGTQAGGTGLIRNLNIVVGGNIVFNWPRVTSDFSRSNSTTATAITGISSVPVGQTGGIRNYKFEAWLATAGSTAGGISVAITCTSSTITALSVDGFILDSNVVRGQQGVITSTTTPVVNSSAITSSTPTVRLQGLIRGVSSGLFGLSLAQSTANATAVVVSSGSWLEVFDIP